MRESAAMPHLRQYNFFFPIHNASWSILWLFRMECTVEMDGKYENKICFWADEKYEENKNHKEKTIFTQKNSTVSRGGGRWDDEKRKSHGIVYQTTYHPNEHRQAMFKSVISNSIRFQRLNTVEWRMAIRYDVCDDENRREKKFIKQNALWRVLACVHGSFVFPNDESNGHTVNRHNGPKHANFRPDTERCAALNKWLWKDVNWNALTHTHWHRETERQTNPYGPNMIYLNVLLTHSERDPFVPQFYHVVCVCSLSLKIWFLMRTMR